MESLEVITAVRLSTESESELGFLLVDLDCVRVAHSDGETACLALRNCDINGKFGQWLFNTDLLPYYDVYISCSLREENADDLYNHFLNCAVCSENRAPQVFYEKVRVTKYGYPQKECRKALINSTVFVTTICNATLEELNYNPEEIDNSIVEWILALECIQSPTHSKMQRIFLVFRNNVAVGDVPETIPTASIAVVRGILEEYHFPVSSSLNSRTVRSIVQDIMTNSATALNNRDIVHQIRDAISAGTKEYRNVSEYLRGYSPLKSCQDYMWNDLPNILPGEIEIHTLVDHTRSFVAPRISNGDLNPHGLTSDEYFAVAAYTYEAGNNIQNSLFYHINNNLRQKTIEALSSLKPYLFYFITALEKIPPESAKVFRVVPVSDLREEMQKYFVGRKVQWTSFTSTSIEFSSALQFRDYERPYIVFEINALTGRNMSKYSMHSYEGEYLLLPNSYFIVSKSEQQSVDWLHVIMIEISTEDTWVF